MHNRFKAISLSHKNAPVELREQLALTDSQTVELLRHIRECHAVKEVLVLSTCNRTEIYYTAGKDLSNELIKSIGLVKGLPYHSELKNNFLNILDHRMAVMHLFRVAVGLESQIIGEMQITNQVKKAYQMTADADLAGPFLHRLLHTTFYANKRVVQESSFRDGAASISYATLELIEQLTISIENPSILIIGTGSVGSDLCKNISSHKGFGHHRIAVTNRTQEKAMNLAAECHFDVVKWDDLPTKVKEVNVVVSAVSSPNLILGRSQFDEMDQLQYKYVIDLSMPSSIDRTVEDISGIVYYDVDDIQTRTDQTLQLRLASIPQVEAILDESIDGFMDWSKEMSVNPTINKLKNALEQIRREEMARYLKNASDDQASIVEKVTKSMMQKVIKLPVLQLKAACKRGEAETLIDLLNDLFDLEKHPSSHNNK